MSIPFSFRQRIVQKVVAMDYRLSLAEHRKGLPIDHLRLPMLLSTATQCANAVDGGEQPEVAFQACFLPTTAYRNLASLLGLKLLVSNGRWMPDVGPVQTTGHVSAFVRHIGSTPP